MRGWVLALVALAPLAGCVDGPGGAIGQVLGLEKASLDGPCGQAYNEKWDQQIILSVRLDTNASRVAEPGDVSVQPAVVKEQRARSYDKERRPDADGCLAFPLQGEGAYHFWAYGEVDGSRCFLMGTTGGSYSGEYDVAKGAIEVSRRC